MEKRIETKADEALMRIKHEGKMTVPSLQKALGVNAIVLEQWVNIFESRGLVEVVYPANPIEPPYVVIKNDEQEKPSKKV